MPHGAAIAVIPHGLGMQLAQFFPGVLRRLIRGDYTPNRYIGQNPGKSLFLANSGEENGVRIVIRFTLL